VSARGSFGSRWFFYYGSRKEGITEEQKEEECPPFRSEKLRKKERTNPFSSSEKLPRQL